MQAYNANVRAGAQQGHHKNKLFVLQLLDSINVAKKIFFFALYT